MSTYKEIESFSSRIQDAILSICKENYSLQGVEVDGIVCVSFSDPTNNCVVKIHKTLNHADRLEHFDQSSHKLCYQTNSNWSHENLQNHFSGSDQDDSRLSSNDEEQMYIYSDNLETDRHVENVHTPRSFQEDEPVHKKQNRVRRQDKYLVHNHYKNSENCETHKISSNLYQRSNIFENNSRQDSSQECSSNIIKTEPDEQNDDMTSPIKNRNKKNNLETIIERFANYSNPLVMESNSEENSKNVIESMDDDIYYEENESPKEMEKNFNNEPGGSEDLVTKYHNSVCIDLSQSDPDLLCVQSEIESHIRSEMDNSELIHKNFNTSFNSPYGDNRMFLSGQKTQTNGAHRFSGLSYKNFKALSPIKKSLKVPFRRPNINSSPQSDPLQQKKVYCKFCGMGFTNSGNKNRHEKSTCGAVKYKCEFCDSLFSRSDSRARHMLYCHGLAIKDRPSDFTPKKNTNKVTGQKTDVTMTTTSPNIAAVFNEFSDSESKGRNNEHNEKFDVIIENSVNQALTTVQ